MSYEFYKVLHFAGLFLVFSAIGGQFACFMTTGSEKTPARKFMGLIHGVGLLIALVAGFGLIARLGVGFPTWVILKLLIWITLGALPVLPAKRPELTKGTYGLLIALGIAAAYLARYKP